MNLRRIHLFTSRCCPVLHVVGRHETDCEFSFEDSEQTLFARLSFHPGPLRSPTRVIDLVYVRPAGSWLMDRPLMVLRS